jgi:hypothetical protein
MIAASCGDFSQNRCFRALSGNNPEQDIVPEAGGSSK